MRYLFCPHCATPMQTAFDGERDRNQCPACAFIHYDNPLPVLAAVVEYEGRVILARNAAWREGMFGLITGFLERDETPEAGILREVKEELDLDAESASLIGVYPFTRRNEVIMAYAVSARGEIRLAPELVEFRAVAPERLRPWRGGTGLALADWMRARGLEYDWADWPAG